MIHSRHTLETVKEEEHKSTTQEHNQHNVKFLNSNRLLFFLLQTSDGALGCKHGAGNAVDLEVARSTCHFIVRSAAEGDQLLLITDI